MDLVLALGVIASDTESRRSGLPKPVVPLDLGGGPMWEPMAIAIMFGLVFSTVLTLGIVPILYSVLFRVNYRSFNYH